MVVAPDNTGKKYKPRDPNRICGTVKRDGRVCQNWKGFRTDHFGYGRCFRCGGTTPNGKTFARREAATQAAVTFGLPREISPFQALLEEVWRTAGHVEWLWTRVSEVTPEEMTAEPPNGEQITLLLPPRGARLWYELYMRERKHLVEVSRAAIACGIAERQVRLAETHAKTIVRVLEGALSDLGIDARSEEARLVLRKHLELASSAQGIVAG